MNKRELLELGRQVASIPLKDISKKSVMSLIRLRIEASEEWKRFTSKKDEIKNQCISIEEENQRNMVADTMINEYLDDKSNYNLQKITEADIITMIGNGNLTVDQGALIYQYLG